MNGMRSEDGVTAIEYALIAALLAIAIIAALTTTGASLTGIFTYLSSQLTT